MVLLSTKSWDIKMNSFETDLKRAVMSRKFAAGLVLQIVILLHSGFDSDLFRISVPITASFPYATTWLLEYENGFIKSYLPRSSRLGYINGKFFSCTISGGLVEMLSCWVFVLIKGESAQINLFLILISGMFWAAVAAVLAAWSENRYIAYGGGFVIYYLLVILYDRYFEDVYCLYPYEWFQPTHIWVLGDNGIVIMLSSFMLILLCLYNRILRRCINLV